jgi:hypothetical protein
VVQQKWKEYAKRNLNETFQVEIADKSIDWQEICRAMLEKHKRLTTNELLFADEEMKFELKDIHVPLASHIPHPNCHKRVFTEYFLDNESKQILYLLV